MALTRDEQLRASKVDSTSSFPSTPDHRIISAGALAGDRVRNRAAEDLGTIEDIMVDVHSGRIAYAVLSFGGFLGIGDKLFAVPWSALELNAGEGEFILDVDKKTLEHAPGFDKDNWPNMADPVWRSQVHAHYGQQLPVNEFSAFSSQTEVGRETSPDKEDY